MRMFHQSEIVRYTSRQIIPFLLIVAFFGSVPWNTGLSEPASRSFQTADSRSAGGGAKSKSHSKPSDGAEQANLSSMESSLLPVSITDGGWGIVGRPREFDSRSLFAIINGEAEKFLKEGFVSMHYITVQGRNNQEQITVELYDQGSIEGSLAVFSEYLFEDVEIRQHNGSVYILIDGSAVGRVDRYFFRLSGSGESGSIIRKTEQIAQALSELSGSGDSLPAEYNVLTGYFSVDPRHIVFQGRNVFQLDFANRFWFGRPDPTKPARLFIHKSDSTEQNNRLYEQLLEELAFDYTIKTKKPDVAVMQHAFLNTWFSLGRKGKHLFGIENEKSEAAAMETLNRFIEGLKDEKG